MKKIMLICAGVLFCLLALGIALFTQRNMQMDRWVGLYLIPKSAMFTDQMMSNDGRMYLTHNAEDSTEYVFADVSGYAFFVFDSIDENGDIVQDHCISPQITNASLNLGDDSSLSGTIFIATGTKIQMRVNDVYQCSDGSVYMTAGNSVMFGGEDEEGFAGSVERNGIQTQALKVSLSVENKHPTQSVVILQMREDHTVISQETMSPETAAARIQLNNHTAYLLAEYTNQTPNGISITRQVLNCGEEQLVLYEEEYGVCRIKYVAIDWGNMAPE